MISNNADDAKYLEELYQASRALFSRVLRGEGDAEENALCAPMVARMINQTVNQPGWQSFNPAQHDR